jgi:DNA polymerase III delta subunit
VIYLIHGQNIVDSRRFLQKLKSSYSDVVALDPQGLTSKKLGRAIAEKTNSFWGDKAALLIENFGGDFSQIPDSLPENLDIILWSGEKLKPKPKIKAVLFEDFRKSSTFKLADAILYRREREALTLLYSLLLAKTPVEKIIGAVGRNLSLALAAKDNLLGDYDLADFVRAKTADQAKNWTKSELKRALVELIRVDVAGKEGAKPSLSFTYFISKVLKPSY